MGRKLYVGNLPYTAGEQDLQDLFAACGQVESVSVMRDMATGRARGFAFVEMATDADAQKAITELHDKAVRRPHADGQRGASAHRAPGRLRRERPGRRRRRPRAVGASRAGRAHRSDVRTGGRRRCARPPFFLFRTIVAAPACAEAQREWSRVNRARPSFQKREREKSQARETGRQGRRGAPRPRTASPGRRHRRLRSRGNHPGTAAQALGRRRPPNAATTTRSVESWSTYGTPPSCRTDPRAANPAAASADSISARFHPCNGTLWLVMTSSAGSPSLR